MKKFSSAIGLALVAALLVFTVAFAMFSNGNFETGDFTGWTKDATYLNAGIVVGPPATYNTIPVSSVSGAVATDDTFIVNTAWMDANFGPGITCDPYSNGEICLPYGGSNSAVVNYLGSMMLASNNMNKLSQSGLIAGGDVGTDGNYHIFFAYAPVLDKGSHTPQDQPFMHVKLIRVRSGSPDKVLFDKFSYPDDGNPNWKISPIQSSVKYMPWQVYDLTYAPAELGAGDTLVLEVVAAGCAYTQGAHWGYVYVDDFGPTAPVTNTAPSITSISPSSGPVQGGTLVTITGTNFISATAVQIDTTTYTAGNFTIVDDNTITVVTQSHTAGTVDVSVTNTNGTAAFPSSFTFVGPSITNITPNSGPVAGGTSVVITGTGFTGATGFTFGGTNATCTVISDTQINCTAPSHTAGAVDVVVTVPGGSATSVGGFTYIATAITGMNPTSGPTSGGTTVVITGTGFTGATGFTFGGTNASCAVNSDTQITCTTPAHTAGPVDVVVTVPGGSATSVGGFTYIPATLTLTASGAATIKPGDPYVYTFNYTTSPTPFNAQVKFTLPGHATFVSNTGGFTCAEAAGVVTCDLGAITANGSFTVTVQVDKLKKVNTPLTLATTAYSISDNGAAIVNGSATVTANTVTPFADVAYGHWALDYIQSIWAYGITGGCVNSPLTYCPNSLITREQMAVYIERAVHGGNFNPGTPALTFTDTAASFAKYFIEALRADGITAGCNPGNTQFCPGMTITRAQVAVFLLRGRSGAAYVPAAATGTVWLDVPANHWAAGWAEELGTAHISSGCGGGKYCPDGAISRAEMAVLVQRTYNLPMPTP
ncbi:MAG: IPT/TIG domain-containing protein [Chloroflexi bacterium]|nr:IPT/TIG domain-containing protein [Chloroflexota bacterium]